MSMFRVCDIEHELYARSVLGGFTPCLHYASAEDGKNSSEGRAGEVLIFFISYSEC